MKKSTDELLNILNQTSDFNTYLSEERENITPIPLKDYLANLSQEKEISFSQCIKKSGLARTYAYQIFSGKKHPTRNKVLALCFGFSLSFEEVQQLLKHANYPILYAKNKRDSAIIFAIQHNCSILEANTLLFDLDLEIIS